MHTHPKDFSGHPKLYVQFVKPLLLLPRNYFAPFLAVSVWFEESRFCIV